MGGLVGSDSLELGVDVCESSACKVSLREVGERLCVEGGLEML